MVQLALYKFWDGSEHQKDRSSPSQDGIGEGQSLFKDQLQCLLLHLISFSFESRQMCVQIVQLKCYK